MAGLVQCCGKTVYRLEQPLLDFDVAFSAVTYNLRRLDSLLRQQPELEARLQSEVDRHKAVAGVSADFPTSAHYAGDTDG